MNTRIANIICAVVYLILLVYVALIYSDLPETIPTHWDAAGIPNDYSDKLTGTLAFLAIPLLGFVVFKLIPVVSPRGFRTDQFADVVNAMMVAFVIFGSVIGAVALASADGSAVNITQVALVCVGALFVVVGNYMGKFRKNFFMGIRTPWTLASDEVWAKTHRLGGRCMVLAGVMIAAVSFITSNTVWAVASAVVLLLIPVVYSYFAYRRIEGFAPDPPIDDE